MLKEKNIFWRMYLGNLLLSIILLILKYTEVINIQAAVCIMPILLFTTFLGVVMLLLAKGLLEKGEEADGNKDACES